MKVSAYRERDYAFGQVMLTLRTRLELTQTELAGILGVRRRAVIDWEGGLTYPKADHLKQFVVLAIERQAWPFGREAEEVRALWQAARQKVLLDEAWLGGLLSHILAPQALSDVSASPERRQDLLLECLRSRRVLLVYDNLESFLEEGEDSGRMRAGYEGFSRVLRRVAETEHQSCLLLTSREKPGDLVPLEGSRAPVRALRLARLDAEASHQLLAEKGVAGSTSEQFRLIEAYAGNPLALKIVARTIVELFDGQIVPFLEQGEVVFGGVRALLDEQYVRLPAVEQSVLLWLAILREPVNLQELLAVLGVPLSRSQVLEAVDGLRRRSLIERSLRQGSFT